MVAGSHLFLTINAGLRRVADQHHVLVAAGDGAPPVDLLRILVDHGRGIDFGRARPSGGQRQRGPGRWRCG